MDAVLANERTAAVWQTGFNEYPFGQGGPRLQEWTPRTTRPSASVTGETSPRKAAETSLHRNYEEQSDANKHSEAINDAGTIEGRQQVEGDGASFVGSEEPPSEMPTQFPGLRSAFDSESEQGVLERRHTRGELETPPAMASYGSIDGADDDAGVIPPMRGSTAQGKRKRVVQEDDSAGGNEVDFP